MFIPIFIPIEKIQLIARVTEVPKKGKECEKWTAVMYTIDLIFFRAYGKANA